MRTSVRRASLALATSVTLLAGLAGPPAQAAPATRAAAPTPRAQAAADWLAGQLSEDHLVVSGYEWDGSWNRYTDYGLSLDVVFAFDDLGVKQRLQRRIVRAIEPEASAYVEPAGTLYAGALGKLLTAVQQERLDVEQYAGGGLLDRLEGLVHTGDDSERGRAQDAPSDDASDTSNSLGQAFVVRALTLAGSDLADEATAFLLAQQCQAGFFRVYMESVDHTCDSGTGEESTPSVDATAAAVLTLVQVRRGEVDGVDVAALDQAIERAGRWLARAQRRDGAFTDGGAANSNSTGLAAQALAALGRTKKAQAAARWLSGLQVTPRLARQSSYRKADVGAVAFTRAALAEGAGEGITRDVRYQWRRATAQAAGGLALLGR